MSFFGHTILILASLASLSSACAQRTPNYCEVVRAAAIDVATWPEGWSPDAGVGRDPGLDSADWTAIQDECGDVAVEFQLGRTIITQVSLVSADLAGVTISHEQYEWGQPGRVWQCVYRQTGDGWRKERCGATLFF